MSASESTLRLERTLEAISSSRSSALSFASNLAYSMSKLGDKSDAEAFTRAETSLAALKRIREGLTLAQGALHQFARLEVPSDMRTRIGLAVDEAEQAVEIIDGIERDLRKMIPSVIVPPTDP